MYVSFCTTLGEFNQIRFVIALIFFLFSSDMVAEGYMFTNGDGTKGKAERLEGVKRHSGCVVTGCKMVAKTKPPFVSFAVYIINDYITSRRHRHVN